MPDCAPDLVPAFPDRPEREGVFSQFEPGTRVLPKGFQIRQGFMPLPVEIVLDKDVAVTLRDGVTIYVDLLRPAGAEKVSSALAVRAPCDDDGKVPMSERLKARLWERRKKLESIWVYPARRGEGHL